MGSSMWMILGVVGLMLVLIIVGGVYIAREQGAIDLAGAPDMEVTMSADPATVPVGGNANFKIIYANLGESPAGSVTIVVTMPEGAEVVEIFPTVCRVPTARDPQDGTHSCNVATIQPGLKRDITFTVATGALPSGTVLTATANALVKTTRDVTKDEINTTNNAGSATVTIK